MVLHIIRALFILMMAAVGWFYIALPEKFWTPYVWLSVAGSVVLATLIVCADILAPRRKLALMSGTLFGLAVGLALAYALSFVVKLVVEQVVTPGGNEIGDRLEQFYRQRDALIEFFTWLVGVSVCYLSISFVLQTRDDFRFIVPYVEFSRQIKGPRPILLDTSVLIDGRVAELAAQGLMIGQLLVPRFVLDELQVLSDQSDRIKRAKGRRGLDVLKRLQAEAKAELRLYEGEGSGRISQANSLSPASGNDSDQPVDHRLISLAQELSARLMTSDTGLAKVAEVRGIDVINLHLLSLAMRPALQSGEHVMLRVQKPGDQPGQGVGYLEDGTMVVVEQARSRVGQDVEIVVGSALQTTAGRMIFARLADDTQDGAGSDKSGNGRLKPPARAG